MTEDDLTKAQLETLAKLRQIRTGTRKAARSGNPRKAAEARVARAKTEELIRRVWAS